MCQCNAKRLPEWTLSSIYWYHKVPCYSNEKSWWELYTVSAHKISQTLKRELMYMWWWYGRKTPDHKRCHKNVKPFKNCNKKNLCKTLYGLFHLGSPCLWWSPKSSSFSRFYFTHFTSWSVSALHEKVCQHEVLKIMSKTKFNSYTCTYINSTFYVCQNFQPLK